MRIGVMMTDDVGWCFPMMARRVRRLTPKEMSKEMTKEMNG